MRVVSRVLAFSYISIVSAVLLGCGGGGDDSPSLGGNPPATPNPGNNSPVFSVGTTSVSFAAKTNDPVPAAETIPVNVTGVNGTVYFSVSFPQGILDNVTVNPTNAVSGVIEIRAKNPNSIAAGAYSEQIVANACLDMACNTHVPGSPQTITVSYTVTAANVANRNICSDSSVQNQDGTASRNNSASCGQYGLLTSRQTDNGMGGDLPVTVDYMVHQPPVAVIPKAVVVLFAGGELDAGITGNQVNGSVATAGANFLVRSAQMFADNGYIAVTLDRPSDRPAANVVDNVEDIDQYRISVDHAVDIARVLNAVGVGNRNVYLIGTSRGALSVFSANTLAAGAAISNPVTSQSGTFPNRLFLNRVGYPRLQSAFIDRPIHVLKHIGDACAVTKPADTDSLAVNLANTGAEVSAIGVTGGFDDINEANPCAALRLHGFLGIEKESVNTIVTWLNREVAGLGMNIRPTANAVTTATAMNTQVQINLANASSDPNGDALSFSVPFANTVRGGTVSVNGSTVAYTPPANANNITDAFVYVVTDGRGGVANATVSVAINANNNNPPVATPLSAATETNTQLQVDLSTLVNDPDGDSLTYALPLATTALGGTVQLVGDRVFNQLKIVTYTPPANVAGMTDSFSYTVADGKGGMATAIISVTINAKIRGQLDLALYQTTVDPILSAACADCHQVPNGAASYDIYFLPLYGSQQMRVNYGEAAKHANIGNPAGSRLLQKAIGNGHGGGQIFPANDQRYLDILNWIQNPVP